MKMNVELFAKASGFKILLALNYAVSTKFMAHMLTLVVGNHFFLSYPTCTSTNICTGKSRLDVYPFFVGF